MTPCKYALFDDPLNTDEPIPGSLFDEIVANADGSSSFKTRDGKYVSQNPNARGSFAAATKIGAYEKFGLIGNLATVWTRPAEGDRMYSYVLVTFANAG
jgi:hypothetical protein